MNSRLDLPIKKPGGYQVRVAVGDAGSQKLGSASQFIEIPDLRPDRLALSGIVLNPKVLGESGPAVRRFKAGDRVSYELEIYNARRATALAAPNLESQNPNLPRRAPGVGAKSRRHQPGSGGLESARNVRRVRACAGPAPRRLRAPGHRHGQSRAPALFHRPPVDRF